MDTQFRATDLWLDLGDDWYFDLGAVPASNNFDVSSLVLQVGLSEVDIRYQRTEWQIQSLALGLGLGEVSIQRIRAFRQAAPLALAAGFPSIVLLCQRLAQQERPLALVLGLSPVEIIQGIYIAPEPLALTIGLGSIEIRRNRAFSVDPLALSLGVTDVRIRPGASTWTAQTLALTLRLPAVSIRYGTFYEIPRIVPSTREFTPPEHPITRTRTQSGTVVSRLWASRPGGGRLRLSFRNIQDVDARTMAGIWDRTRGRRYGIQLPEYLFEGAQSELRAYLTLGDQLMTWGLSQPPVIQSVIPGISNLELEFIGKGYGVQSILVTVV